MKKNIAITPTGSSPLATILVRRFRILLRAITALLVFLPEGLLSGCHDREPSTLVSDTVTDYLCNGTCEKLRLKPFLHHAVHVEIEPTGEMSQVFYNLDPNTLSKNPIVLKKMVQVSGKALGAETLLALEEERTERDKSDSFSDILAIPTINKVTFLSPRIPTVKARLLSDSSYQISLFEGLSYTLVLNPEGKLDHAPIYINQEASPSQTTDFLLENNQTELTGRIISEDVTIFSNNRARHLNAQVIQGTRLVSSLAQVRSDGTFSLKISNPFFDNEDDQPFILVIEPTDDEIALPRITRKLEMEQLKNDLDVGTINVGKLKRPFSLTINIVGADDTPIGNAFLSLRAKIGAGVTLIKKQVDRSGSMHFENLFEGTYDIAVIPPFESAYGMTVIKEIQLDVKKKELSIKMPERKGLYAEVLAPSGHAISGAQIELMRVGEMGNFATDDIYDDMLFKLTANTNDNGEVCNRRFGFVTSDNNECAKLLLDDGRYLGHIIPPAGTDLSHKWITFDFPKNNQLSIMLDHPEVLSAQILAADQKTPIKNAFVTVYLAETNMHNQPKVIGSAMTDEDGYFKAFVSAP